MNNANPVPVRHVEYSETVDIGLMDGSTARSEVEQALVRLREYAGRVAKEWLLNRGHLNCTIDSEMTHHADTGNVDVKVTLNDFGLIEQGVA